MFLKVLKSNISITHAGDVEITSFGPLCSIFSGPSSVK